MHRVEGWAHVYRRNNGTLYYVRRVPSDLVDLIPNKQFKRSLKHRDERLPVFKATYDAVHHQVETYISNIRRGLTSPDTMRDYEAAVLRAQRLGFDLRPMSALADDSTSIEEVFERLAAVEARLSGTMNQDVDAVLGAVTKPAYSLLDALEYYVTFNAVQLRDKNESQRRRWRNPLDLAIKNFTDLVGQKQIDQITRDDALRFREWWVNERIGRDIASANTANKSLMALRKIFRVVNDAHRLGLENPFDGLSIAKGVAAKRVSLQRTWLEQTMLTQAALSGLNDQARCVILTMADTGARVNEITGLEAADIKLAAEVPHIIIQQNSVRALKTERAERVIPLVGVALTAMRDYPDGFPRYAGKNASASAAINKYLKSQNLLPDGATLYGLRHGFQDRLIEVEAPERVQADLMGHKTLRPKYGKGPSLQQFREWLLRIALGPKIA